MLVATLPGGSEPTYPLLNWALKLTERGSKLYPSLMSISAFLFAFGLLLLLTPAAILGFPKSLDETISRMMKLDLKQILMVRASAFSGAMFLFTAIFMALL